MRRVGILAALAALALAACGQREDAAVPTSTHAPPAEAPLPAADTPCSASAQARWNGLAVEAYTAGPACAQAAATLIVRGADGREALRFEAPAEHIFDLREAADSEAMTGALAGWIGRANPTLATSAGLPDWPAGALQPAAGEFPFYVEEGVTRSAYLAARAAAQPMFCHTQGLESIACYVLDGAVLKRLGAQSFPG